MRTRRIISILLATYISCSYLTAYSQSYPPPLMFTEMDGVLELDNGMEVPIWGYGLSSDGYITLPGPLLEYETGDNVTITFSNPSAESHTIHLHGLDVDQANDGVPATSFLVPQDEIGSYSFTSSKPGTFLYHCHVTTTLHLTMGMYGMILVRHPGGVLFENGPSYHSDAPLLFSDLEIATNLTPVQSYPFHDIRPDYFMVNGKSGSQLEAGDAILSCPANDTLALRLGSMAYTVTKLIFPQELNATCWMSDGRPVPEPFEVDTINIFPGERFTILISPSSEYDGEIEVESWDMVNCQLVHTNYIRVRDAALNIEEFGVLNNSNISADHEIYPNPASKETRIQSANNQDINGWKVYNELGKIIAKGYSPSSFLSLDISTYKSGIYFFQDESGRSSQFIKTDD